MHKVLIAAIDDAGLERLVCDHRDNAGRAARLHKKPVDATRYADVQNGFADIFQDLLDRRRASKPPMTQREKDELAWVMNKPRSAAPR